MPEGIAEAPGRTPAVGRNDDQNVGLDLFYNVTPNLRANLTVNTDFAETEVDQRQVNLTRFPLQFPERRAFFLEGGTFFDFQQNAPVDPFVSRRIGLDRIGQPQTIDGGVKLEHCKPLAAHGASVLVAGSAVFEAEDPGLEVRRMREAALSD